METGKIVLEETAIIQGLVNDMLDLRLDLGKLRLEVANMGGRLLCHDDNCPHCPEIREALRKAQPPTKKES